MNRIVIIDDHQLLLHGLKLTLEDDQNQVAVFVSPEQALLDIEQSQPDLILTDLYMPEMSGICLLEELTKRQILTPVIVLSACEEYKNILTALQKGAMGFIPKYYSPEAMQEALQQVLQGNIFIPDEIAGELEELAQQERENRELYQLSQRQQQILELIHQEKTNRQIAEILSITQDTVKFHQRGLYQILDVSGAASRIKAVEKAIQVGLLESS